MCDDCSETVNAVKIQMLRSDHCLSFFTQSKHQFIFFYQFLNCDLPAQLAWVPGRGITGSCSHTLVPYFPPGGRIWAGRTDYDVPWISKGLRLFSVLNVM